MKQLFAARLTMVEACISAAESEAAAWSGFEGFTQPFHELKALVPQMIRAMGTTAQKTRPVTVAKEGLRKSLETATFRLASALTAYGMKNRDDELLAGSLIKRSHLQAASGEAVLGFASHRLGLAQGLPASVLLPWGFTSGLLDRLADKVHAYAASLGKPRDRRLEIQGGRVQAEGLMDDALRLLRFALDPAVAILSEEHPFFAARWTAARRQQRRGHRARSLTIAVRDGQSGAAIEGAAISILPAGVERVSSAFGNAIVQNLAEGHYTATVSHSSFGQKEVPFDVVAGQTTALAVVMG